MYKKVYNLRGIDFLIKIIKYWEIYRVDFVILILIKRYYVK